MATAAAIYRRDNEAAQQHKRRQRYRDYNRGRRPEDHAWYGRSQWRNFRKMLQADPEFQLCSICGQSPPLGQHCVMDHIKPRRTHPELELVQSNIRPLCRSCHERHGERADRQRSHGCDAEGNPTVSEDW